MYRHGPAYLFSSEHMSSQFNHSKVPTAESLIQVIEPSNLPIMVTLEPRHGCLRTAEGMAAFCRLPGLGQFSISV